MSHGGGGAAGGGTEPAPPNDTGRRGCLI